MAKEYGLVVYGATGFTGRQTVRYLLGDVSRLAGLGSWAIAGRSREKLLAMIEPYADLPNRPEVIVADGNDAASVDAMVARARVIVNLAGPYCETGTEIVRACISHRTDYVDLTGETFWIQHLIREHHWDAAVRKVKIIPCCGYEALPFDLATLMAARTLRERHGVDCAAVRIVASFTGSGLQNPRNALSGGTVGTFKLLLAKDFTDCISDPACLVPVTANVQGVRAVNAFQLDAVFEDDLNAWTAPMIPAPFVNPPIVLRSAALLGESGEPYAEGFRYTESVSMAAFTPYKAAQWAAAKAMALSFRQFLAMFTKRRKLQRDATRLSMEWIGPQSGQGPSESALEQSGYRLDIFATGTGGQSLRGVALGQGHPGYRSTANIVAQAGLALALQRRKLPKTYGILTPASAFGLAANDRFEQAGLSFDFSPTAGQ